MASIEPRINANGVITSYRIIVSDGADYQGNPIKYRMLWTPPRRNMTEKQIQKELHAAAVRFEDDIRQGYKLNSNQTFFEYAQYVMELKERTGIKTLTLDRYLEMLPRIYEAIGHLKLSQIRPQHLNEFYMNLSKPGARADSKRATPKPIFNKRFESLGISKQQLARESGVSPQTISAVTKGDTLRMEKAEALADAMGMDFKKLFDVTENPKPLSPKTIREHHLLISTILGQAEKEMIRLVREGDLDYKKHMKVIASTGRVGNIADGTALRQLKNMLIVNITLFSRAAMDGGLPPETGYTLSDRYLQAVEKSNSMKSLAEINTAMQDDFIQRVHQYRQNKDLSKPIRICVEQLQSRMEEPITLEDLAKDFGYSTYYLSKKFKAETGQAFKDYLRSIRLERAKFLLRSSELSILEISEKLQFCSASYFSDSLRKAYGISPSAYREQI